MVTETYTVVACPYSWKPLGSDEGDPAFHVSLFVAPRLLADGDRGRLDEFELFSRWGRLLPDLHLELADQRGVLECRPVTARFDPTLWERMFPSDTPVVANGVPTDWAETPYDWRSYDARAVADLATHHAVIAAASSLVDLPPAAESPLLEALVQDLEPGFEDGREPSGTRVPRRGKRSWNESKLTHYLDEVTAGLRPDVVARLRASGGIGALQQLHRLRRFYERAESVDEYRRTPDPEASSAPLPPPDPEFHERVTAAGDHPDLLRALGLVVDLEVADLERLRRATRLTGRLRVEPTDQRGRAVTLAVTGLDDGALVSVPSGDDWSDGLLRVGDTQSYAVLDHDVDGSGLKTERFVMTLPRLALADPRSRTHAAPPALRASGLTLVRTDQALRVMRRVEVQVGVQQRLDSGLFDELLMHTEDVMRGLRVEVWDDEARTWHGLHDRLTTISVDGVAVLTDEPTVGFLQGTAITRTAGVEDSPRYVHEAVFGWEGWSLSAERPGQRIRFDHDADPALNPGHEVVEPTAPLAGEKPPHPFAAHHVVRPRSLPRLRYGRSYAFRVFGVDLAGNSRPLPPKALRKALGTDAQLRRQLAEVTPATPTLDPALVGLRGAAARVVARTSTTVSPPRSLRGSVTRRATLSRLSADVVGDVGTPLVRATQGVTAAELSGLVAAAAADLSWSGSLADVVRLTLATTTRLTPFLRWDPVAPPVVVPRRRFTEGESQRVLVVRSGVRQDPETLEVSVSTPAAYAGEVSTADPGLGYHADCQRHLVPPKTTQMTAELHGRFDTAVGKSSPAAKQKMLTWALAEEGSLLDPERPDLDVPGGRLPQEGVTLAANDPTVVPASLPLPAGEAPPTGQYVVHDTDRLVTPYLPDPLAAGISLVFPEAVEGIGLTGHDATEGFTTEYGGTWPKVQPIRLDLVGRPVLDAERKGRTLTVGLPAGDLQRFRLSSSLRVEELDLLAVWRKLPAALTDDPGTAEAAKDGWLWSLTPYDDVLLVHAVPRPVQAPRVHVDTVVRLPGATAAGLVAELWVHGSSTQSVTAEATWTEHLDDVVVPSQPQHQPSAAVGFTVPVDEHDTVLALRLSDQPLGAAMEHVPAREARHHFPDTKHRRVTYTFRATTRFREYFHPSLVTPDPAVPGDDGLSVVSEPVQVSIPSSARPAAPAVHSVIPLFRWTSGTEAEQPMGWRHERSSGVRIYLDRPWFSSGEGELLAVLLATGGDDDFGGNESDQSGFPFVSKIGADPIWDAPTVDNRAVVDLQLASLLVREHSDGVAAPGRPVEVREGLRLPATGDAVGASVTAAAYRPQFNAERGLWYVDVAIDPWAHVAGRRTGDRSQEAFWPFLRLAVARYQPESIAGHHLSAPVQCRYVQLPPSRTTSVDRTDERSVRVVVSGTTGDLGASFRAGVDPNRVVIATLARRDPDVPTDLGWMAVASTPLTVRGRVGAWDVAWVGELTAPERFPLRRPSPDGTTGRPEWRVTVEEWERFAGDPPLAGDPASGPPVWEQRLVHADEFLL